MQASKRGQVKYRLPKLNAKRKKKRITTKKNPENPRAEEQYQMVYYMHNWNPRRQKKEQQG